MLNTLKCYMRFNVNFMSCISYAGTFTTRCNAISTIEAVSSINFEKALQCIHRLELRILRKLAEQYVSISLKLNLSTLLVPFSYISRIYENPKYR